jgi:hypothetical protein
MGFMDDVRRSVERIVPRGREIYEHRIRPGLEPEDVGAFVVIEVESDDYAIAADEEAFARVEARHQDGVFFFSRVGPGGEAAPAHRIGAGAHH